MFMIIRETNMHRSDMDRWWVAERKILPSGTKIESLQWGPYDNESTAIEVRRLAEKHNGKI